MTFVKNSSSFVQQKLFSSCKNQTSKETKKRRKFDQIEFFQEREERSRFPQIYSPSLFQRRKRLLNNA